MRRISDFLAALSRTKHILPIAIAWALCLVPPSFAGEATTPVTPIPLLNELRKPVEAAPKKAEDAPAVPAPVRPERRIVDPATLCPEGAVWYLTVPDSARLTRDWESSPLGALMREPAMERTFRNNRFGLQYLFADLPSAVVSQERMSIISSLLELSHTLAGMSEKMAVACYLDGKAGFRFLFLFDVGLNREPAFAKMAEWETSFFLANPGADVVRGDHAGNYLDVWQVGKRGDNKTTAAAGFAENMAIVSNDSDLAAAGMALLQGGASLASSPWGKRLAASIPAASAVDAAAFLRMDALLDGMEQTPIARDLINAWTDYLGNGSDREAIYYGLQFTGEGSRETFLLPTSGQSTMVSLLEVLSRRLQPYSQWHAPAVIPYLPSPAFYLGAKLAGKELGSLLGREHSLFGLSNNANSFVMPQEARRLFGDGMAALLTGEVGLAFFPQGDEEHSPWMMALPCTDNPTPLLPKVKTLTEKNGMVIHSPDPDWLRTPGWTVVSPSAARRLQGHFLLLASNGRLLEAALEQLISGASFLSNRDFARAMDRMEENQGLFFYLNAPEILVREYPNLSPLMRSLYPRSSGLNSRPSLALLRRYAQGFLGSVAPASAGDGEFTRMTMQAPIPSLGALAAAVTLQFPRNLRVDGREAMLQSQENLKNLWLRLQLYSNRFGHFPDNLDELASEMRAGMTDEEIRAMFTAPAALARLNPTDAAQRSYRYLSGATPGDEPDLPFLYEAEPWSEDFSGMYPTLPDRGPSESGAFQPYRQMILLDGTVRVVPEKRFQEKILSRLQERE